MVQVVENGNKIKDVEDSKKPVQKNGSKSESSRRIIEYFRDSMRSKTRKRAVTNTVFSIRKRLS